MALDIPESSRRPIPVDVSSKILHRLDTETVDTVTSSLVRGWISELDDSIQAIKVHVHERIQSEVGRFHQQFESSKSVDARYETLSARVDELNHTLSDAETGIHPKLLNVLTKHSALAQDTSNAEALYQIFSKLLTCRNAYTALSSLVQTGRLPEAVKAAEQVESLVAGVPDFLKHSQVVEALRKKVTSTKARIQDQLSDAYSRCISVSATEIVILPQVQVRLSETILPLPALLQSLTSVSLSNHLAILRRDLMARFIDPVIQHPHSISIQYSPQAVKLSLALVVSHQEDLPKRFDNLTSVLNFLVNNLLPHLPSQEAAQFKCSLSKSLANNALNYLLMPALPSSFGLLPSFLTLLRRGISFEKEAISGLLEEQCSIRTWSDGVAGHYERRRRVDILEKARSELLVPDDVQEVFAIIDDGPEIALLNATSVRNDSEMDAWGLDEPSSNLPEENAWNLDEPSESSTVNDDLGSWAMDESINQADDSWGLDEDITTLPDAQDSDPTDAWDWNDDNQADVTIDDNAWDDPWAASTETSPPSNVLAIDSAKVATRLEKKLALKEKKNGHLSPISTTTANATSQSTSQRKEDNNSRRAGPVNAQESYLVSKRTINLMKMVETVIDESKLFYASNLFDNKDVAPPPRAILSQSASSILDLYQAIYPIKHAKSLEESKNAFLLSNNYLYMTSAIQRIEDTLYGQSVLKERLAECRHNLQVSSNIWFDETIERQRRTMNEVLDAAQGFISTSDQEQYDECESAVNTVLQNIKRLAQQLKGVLGRSKYYTAIGLITDACLSRMLHDILALPDITEVESHRLSELCHILHALEGLFSGEAGEPPFAAFYIPHWLKFSYLSELMEASLADIAYLFEQGALVDFKIDELVKLVRALFADTPMRTNTINKILNGHPSTHL